MKLSTGVRSIFSTLIFIGLVLGMQACGGSGGGTPTPADANPTGYYENTGIATVDATAAINDLQAMINGNRLMMISDTEGLFYDGTITSISVNDFTANVSVFKHGEPIASPSATISGTITEKSKITGTLTGIGAGNGIFTLQYATTNNLAADLTRIERDSTTPAQWESDIGGGGDTTRFEVVSGTIGVPNFSSNGFFAGCNVGSGSFTPINGTSLYEVTMNVTGCTTNPGADLTYVGLAASWTLGGSADDRLAIGVTDVNSTFSINGDFK